jgi:hypothetical protein
MQVIQNIRCPNCGSEGERHYIAESNIIRTQCPTCDYLLVTCSDTSKVIESYAPGLDSCRLNLRSSTKLSASSIGFQTARVPNANGDLLLL